MMDPNQTVSIVAVSGTFLTAIATLIQNNKALNRLEKHWDERFRDSEKHWDERFRDLKELLKVRFDAIDERLNGIDKRLDTLDMRVKVLEDESRSRVVPR